MPLSYQELYLILIILFCALFDLVIAWKKPRSKNNRTRILWKLAVLDTSLFSVGLMTLIFFLPQSPLNILSWIVYDSLITYVLCIEVPAYLKISSFDDNLSGALKGIRKELVEMHFSFAVHLQNLKTQRDSNRLYLEGENLDNLLGDFIAFSNEIENLNENIWNLTLNETSNFIDEVTKRSKHPFPKLIDILTLSGLSLLIAQFLKLLG
jgi:hypothetical protein